MISPFCVSCAASVKETRTARERVLGDLPLALLRIGLAMLRNYVCSILAAEAATFSWKRSSSWCAFAWPRKGSRLRRPSSSYCKTISSVWRSIPAAPRSPHSTSRSPRGNWREHPSACHHSISHARDWAPSARKDAWVQVAERVEDSSGLALERDLFGGDPSLRRGPLQAGMAALYELFERGPELGSLLDPGSLESTLFRADFKSLRELLESAIKWGQPTGRDEQTVAAAGMARGCGNPARAATRWS